MLPSWYPPHRLIVSSAATRYIIHEGHRFVNGFFKILQIFISSFPFSLIISVKTNAGAARPSGYHDSSGPNASWIQLSFLARSRTRQERPLPVHIHFDALFTIRIHADMNLFFLLERSVFSLFFFFTFCLQLRSFQHAFLAVRQDSCPWFIQFESVCIARGPVQSPASFAPVSPSASSVSSLP